MMLLITLITTFLLMTSVNGDDERDATKLEEAPPADYKDDETPSPVTEDADGSEETVVMAAGDKAPREEDELRSGEEEGDMVAGVGDCMKTVTIASSEDIIYENGFSDNDDEPKSRQSGNETRRESGDVRRQMGVPNSGITRYKNNTNQRPMNTQSTNTTPRRYRRVWRASASARSRSSMFTNSQLSTQRWSYEPKRNRRFEQFDDTVSSPRSGGDTASAKLEGGGEQFGTSGYPIIYTGPTGTITIILRHNVMIETTVDRAIRVFCHDKFSSVCNGSGTTACLLHPKAKIHHRGDKVYCNFSGSPLPSWKAAAFGPEGVLFTMSHLAEAYLVSSTVVPGTTSMPLGHLQFPSLNYDFTLSTFYGESQSGNEFMDVCNEIAKKARHGVRDDGSLTLAVNGLFIKQMANGDVEVNTRPRHISCSPVKGTIRVRTDMVDMAVQDGERAYVKRGMKHVHVSRSGMVASDGSYVTSMDHAGRIVSST